MKKRLSIPTWTMLLLAFAALSPTPVVADDSPGQTAPPTVLFQNATIWTQAEQGCLHAADLLISGGKIVAIGDDLKAPSDAEVVDATGKHLTPGLIDTHSHVASRGGINESANNITPEVRIEDVIDPDDINIYRLLAGGVTSSHVLHGSANSMGGQDAVIKMHWNATADDLVIPGRKGIKLALGENPKQSNRRGQSGPPRYPQTRMGVIQSLRKIFIEARTYQRQWQEYSRLSAKQQERQPPPRRDLQLEAVVEILNGERTIHCHAYRQDEMLAMLRLAEEYGLRVTTIEHGLEGYKIADELAAHGVGVTTQSDWWGYKMEAYDATPYNAALLHDRGVEVTFSSDSAELARRLNLEAAKAVKYGGVGEQQALSFVTLNPARQLGIDHRTGSLEQGKDADLVLWSEEPLSVYSIVEQTWVDGIREFDRATDAELRQEMAKQRSELIARIRGGDKDESQEENQEHQEEADEQPAVDDESERGTAPVTAPLDYQDRLAALGGTVSIVGATVHTMVGEPIVNGTVSFRDGKIIEVGAGLAPVDGARVVDASGKHIYPGLIDANNVIGLVEIMAVAASVDISETGAVNPSLNAAIAVNPDSALIPVTRANGLTHVLTAPGGDLVRGTSALIRLDGWTWEDLTAATPVAMHVSWPAFQARGFRFFGPSLSPEELEKQRKEKLAKIDQLLADARAYAIARQAEAEGGRPVDIDAELEAMLPVLAGKLRLIVHAEETRQIKNALEWAEEEGIGIIIAGRQDVWRVADLLAEKQVPVILTGVHSLPSRHDEPYDTAYTTAAKLHAAGVRFCIAGAGGFSASNARNLPYQAGMAAAFGLSKNEALRALTLYPAEILGVDDVLGSIETGKSASIILTDGDPLEIRTNVERVFIDGREADIHDNRHERLYRRYAARP
jgi:imidazolonepropionase-like amidohydrolase